MSGVLGRAVAVAAGVALVAACGARVSGAPVPAAGFGPASSPAVTDTAPRSLTGVDLCALLTPDDLTPAGGLAGTPGRRADTFPDSCGYPLRGGAAGDYVLVALYKPLAQVRHDQPGGHAERTLGYDTWLHCAVSDGYRTCTASVAVRDDRSLLVAMDKRDTPEGTLLRLLQPLTEGALRRLPRA